MENQNCAPSASLAACSPRDLIGGTVPHRKSYVRSPFVEFLLIHEHLTADDLHVPLILFSS